MIGGLWSKARPRHYSAYANHKILHRYLSIVYLTAVSCLDAVFGRQDTIPKYGYSCPSLISIVYTILIGGHADVHQVSTRADA